MWEGLDGGGVGVEGLDGGGVGVGGVRWGRGRCGRG